MGRYYDVIVVGAGPAGLTASRLLAEMGIRVLTLDEQHRVGGQIYRRVQTASNSTLSSMGDEYRRGLELADHFHKSGAEYENGATVWNVERDGRVTYSRNGISQEIQAGYIIIATGAMERPFPLPGWNLPGVMGAGAANNLAKEAGLLPSGNVVLAGSGPILLLEASVLAKKGVQIAAILETTSKIPSGKTLQHVIPALRRTDFLFKGLKMLRDIKNSGIPHYKGVSELSAIGKTKVEAVEAVVNGKKQTFPADLFLLHFGVIPNSHIFRLIGCTMRWNSEQRYWFPSCDRWGRTSFEKIFAAGDGAGVRGALAAEYRGKIAALEVARCLGFIPKYERDTLAEPIFEAINYDSLPRPFIDAMYSPKIDGKFFKDETTLCRCENVSVGDVRKAVKEGVCEVNEVKIVTRCGMGPCQGRMCGPALAEIVAAELDSTPEMVGFLSIRPPLKAIPFSEIAKMNLNTSSQEEADLFKNMKK
ncbi:NAD(P)/FAD-dependent oxidoreductase [Desulforhopalus singaporensis]|uniref:NADPH-dependent 2,4-dienoyl-CoA reductase, sulfur reductase n=1 Tax=Desulforhopalus singaporensis TaxID=91360 RepID=A0A1H0R2C9_9BACT|nr:FAD/NAD(P)-binding oxidoreductase [Desulforhopalus singaporensis]SDP23148.1 NADPH-dependent 2,4-dienoyl-CoA reductase, sulfur reductase [Desulforhopalus singaporensis]